MSSFSCQYIDSKESYCLRLKKDCVPGRQGCVLKGRFVFAMPAQKRIEENEKLKTSGLKDKQAQKPSGDKK